MTRQPRSSSSERPKVEHAAPRRSGHRSCWEWMAKLDDHYVARSVCHASELSHPLMISPSWRVPRAGECQISAGMWLEGVRAPLSTTPVLCGLRSLCSSQGDARAQTLGTGSGDRSKCRRDVSVLDSGQRKSSICWYFLEPSDGLRTVDPSFPCRLSSKRGQRMAKDLTASTRFSGPSGCGRFAGGCDRWAP
jgi:hypothetical protein